MEMSSVKWRYLLVLLLAAYDLIDLQRRQSLAYGIFGQFRHGAYLQLVHYLLPVCFDRLYAEIQRGRYLLGALALGQELEDLAFPHGKDRKDC